MYDLVLQGGHVIDPGQGINEKLDIGIQAGKIGALSAHIPASEAREVVDVSGLFVTPGLIDLHAHVYWGANDMAVEVDPTCLSKGVTTVVDAGTAGALNFAGFRRFIIEQVKTRVLCFLNIGPTGLTESYSRRRFYDGLSFSDVARPIEVANRNRDVVLGIKVLLSHHYTGDNALESLWLARFTADKVHGRLMVHFGNSNLKVEEIVGVMRGGDILTHCFNGYVNGILGWDGKVAPAVCAALERGVLLDVGFGSGSFSVDVARQALSQGIRPTISTDLHHMNVQAPVRDLPTTMSKFLALGLGMREVIAAATVDAARSIGRANELGSLRAGAVADIAAFELVEGEFEFRDSHDTLFAGDKVLDPRLTVRAGNIVARNGALL